MDGQFWVTLLKILIFFPFIIALILIFGKLGTKLNLGTSNKYMKVLERLPLSKENSLAIVKVGDKGYLMSSSTGKIEILKELDSVEIETIKDINEVNLEQLNKTIKNINLKSLNLSSLSKRQLKKESEQ
ncbi:flagellar biosynthetic protein FliO [Clostridium sp.]|uniref:flagellar biosynthetic protein FliO n=1 Tax=Clostridium sp. TaxID=1506 RepID=UPI002FCAF87A